MRTAVYTLWQNDLVILDLWLSYYSRYFDDVFIICNGTEDGYIPLLEERKAKYKFTYKRLESFLGDPGTALSVVKENQLNLLKDHDWVLYCNCDEIIATNPKKFKDLKELMETCDKDWVACVGYDVVEWNEPAIDYSKPFFAQRKYWVKDHNYNKILLSKVPLAWNEGQHQIDGISGEDSKSIKGTGLYLVHLKHADLEAEAANVNGRHFGPMRTSADAYIMDRRKDSRLKIPSWLKELL